MDRHQLAKRVKRYKNKIKTTFYKEDYRVKYRWKINKWSKLSKTKSNFKYFINNYFNVNNVKMSWKMWNHWPVINFRFRNTWFQNDL